jgi:O-antigen ligase
LINKQKIRLLYATVIAFILLNAYLIIGGNYYLNILPFVAIVFLFAIFSIKNLIYVIVFLTPLSIQLEDIVKTKMNMALPTEPLIFGVLLLLIIKLLIEKSFDRKILKHPISITLYIYLAWLLITSLTSVMPIVSLKYMLVRVWYIGVFYFVVTEIFKKFSEINKFVWIYIISFLFVITYSIIRLAGYGLLNQKAAHFVMTPFYNDHTSYGAVLAMFIVILMGFLFYSKYSKAFKYLIGFILAYYIFAIIFSYTRAAWLGLVIALGVFTLVKLKISFKFFSISIGTLLILFLIFQKSIFLALKDNDQDSSTDLANHVKSISNVSTDASNVERINRWNCAFRMFAEKPIFGWGPGTYQFNYAPYQRSYEKTIISTNSGDMGNAHSEYIGPLSDSGVLGSLTFILIVIVTIYTGLRVYNKTKNKDIRLLSLIFTLSLITYYFHGFLNNFLDTDKAAVPFWGFTAILVALDVYHTNDEKSLTTQTEIETTKIESIE